MSLPSAARPGKGPLARFWLRRFLGWLAVAAFVLVSGGGLVLLAVPGDWPRVRAAWELVCLAWAAVAVSAFWLTLAALVVLGAAWCLRWLVWRLFSRIPKISVRANSGPSR